MKFNFLEPKISAKFHSEDAEITFRSSDGVLFRIHETNLQACTEDFSPPEESDFSQVVQLTETASVLEVLFQFIYPMPQPGLESFSPAEIASLAEAAEKYQVHPAMGACRIYMKKSIPKNALGVLAYATRHDYLDLASLAAPHVLDHRAGEIIAKIPPEFVAPWLKYYDLCVRASRTLNTRNFFGSTHLQVDPFFKTLQSTCRGETSIKGIPPFAQIVGEMTVIRSRYSNKHPNRRQTSSIPTEPKLSGKFRSADADITFRSSDNVLFRVHKINLQACTKGFSPPEASDFGEAVQLTETATILEVLFQFIYPMPQPRLESFSPEQVASLADAAEKYQVHPAMGACRIYMKESIPKNALGVLAYATRYNYPDLASLAAPYVLDSPVDEIIVKIPPEFIAAWLKYYDGWARASQRFILPIYNYSRIDVNSPHFFNTLHTTYGGEPVITLIPPFARFMGEILTGVPAQEGGFSVAALVAAVAFLGCIVYFW